jgi:endonuclease-8
MPEGDTIFRAARTLDTALAGARVVAFDSVLPALTRVHADAPLTGRTIERVASVGKHLLIYFSGDLVLRTHMKMSGSWHIYRRGERWQRPRADMRIVVATEKYEAVGFRIPVAELTRTRTTDGARAHPALKDLGPDLLSDDFDVEEVLRRARENARAEIADVLLNQRVMAGVGNVYKSEVLFVGRVSPFAAVRSLGDEKLRTLVVAARGLLRANVSLKLPPMTTYTGFRRTTARQDPAERLWVYGRARRPCRTCGTPIAVRPQGPHARLTYWCPECQKQ